MISLGTPLSPTATRIALCGGGELGKEVVIELQRLGCEVIVIDRYANAPAMQVAHRSHVVDMLDGAALRAVLELEKPHLIVPEVEAIATDTLVALEAEGFTAIPTARATQRPVWVRKVCKSSCLFTASKTRYTVASSQSQRDDLGLP